MVIKKALIKFIKKYSEFQFCDFSNQICAVVRLNEQTNFPTSIVKLMRNIKNKINLCYAQSFINP